ncbi:glycosyltransferase family 2 protein [Paenibacillus sp. 481]|uniref:glycosyltransferase family 2 protein n=1 Tax=Paenibacillus sp. 481 TaxID=2835869 RepID=UPI001E5020CF|nr:glycosyltransferase family A protein [Paenibacillus sp. 481]UHA75478.1 glycosyltransferase family 2 protein [Paenibacillus sp. 481]
MAKKQQPQPKGVSIITCTRRAHFIHNVFRNYNRQTWAKKELIIILNKDDMKIAVYKQLAKKYKNVSIYQLPEKTSLGHCLNLGVSKSKYDYVAKFDDDDYYAPKYVAGSVRAIENSKADIVGKRAYYCWLEGKRTLVLRFPKTENKFVRVVAGATLFMKREVLRNVPFSNVSLGEDVQFCTDSRAKGYRLYAGSKYNFAAIRRKNRAGHTWKAKDDYILKRNAKIVPGVRDFRKYVTK